MHKLKILMIAIVLFCLNSIAQAAVPHLINYQGRLTDNAGLPLEGTYELTFRIYDAETAGNLLWQGTYSGVNIQKGIFSIFLGDVNDQGYNFSALSFDKAYWLEIKIGSEVMSPRQKITSAGYAIRTETAENALQAQNANTLVNVGLSTLPAANKILPLDNNAKFPFSALSLKVYDSGWFFVSANNIYTKTHNLGTTKLLVLTYSATDANGGGMLLESYAGTNYMGIRTYNINATQVTIRPSIYGFHFCEAVYNPIASGYARIVILALE